MLVLIDLSLLWLQWNIIEPEAANVGLIIHYEHISEDISWCAYDTRYMPLTSL